MLVEDQKSVYALDKGDPNYDSTEDSEKTVFREKTLIEGSEAYDRVKEYKMAASGDDRGTSIQTISARLGYG